MNNAPLLVRNHFASNYGPKPLLFVHADRVRMPEPPAIALVGAFTPDGEGGLIVAARAADQRCGYLDGDGQWLIEPTLDAAFGFTIDRLSRFCQDGRWGFLDPAGRVVIAPRFEDALGFQYGVAPVMADGQWRYVDRDGDFVFAQAFGYATCFNEAGLAVAGAGDREGHGVIDRDGNWVIAPRFAHILPFGSRAVTPASLDGKKYGLIDTAGNWVMQPSYRYIRGFNDQGLAYFSDFVSGRYGYLDTTGRTVIASTHRLATTMVGGFALDGDDCFRNAEGELRTSEPVSWATAFTAHGFAIAKRSERGNDNDNDGDDEGTIQPWGLLRGDGSFIPAPPDVAEPLTDDDDMIVWPERGTPLAAFATRDGNVALMDVGGTIVYRLEREQDGGGQAPVLRDADGREIWRGAQAEWLPAQGHFFTASAESFLNGLDSIEDIDGVVDTLLAETEARLYAFAAGQLLDGESDDDEDEDEEEDDYDDEDEEEDDEDDPWSPVAKRIGRKKRIFDSYLDETVWGAYEFLGYHRQELGEKVAHELIARLRARFGSPEPEAAMPYYVSDGEMSCWTIPLSRPIAEQVSAPPATLWLGLAALADTGDGDIWFHIDLHCYPDLATLEAAMRVAGYSSGH